jgi:DNA-binding transcriptional LysR family regulator
MTTLDVDAVQAFVAIADHQSFTRAARALGTTQGALSVKLKRLEERIGHKLIERTPRSVRVSAQGALFLDAARDFLAAHEHAVAALSAGRRRFVLGIATHVGGPEVPTVLARLNAHDPALTIEVRLDNAPTLLATFDRGEIDAVIIRREDDRRDGEVLGREHFGWFASSEIVLLSTLSDARSRAMLKTLVAAFLEHRSPTLVGSAA